VPPLWLLAALVIVPLAQVPLVAYLSRYVALDLEEQLQSPDSGYVTYGSVAAQRAVEDSLAPQAVIAARESDDGGLRLPRCPHCGAVVDPTFDYCGQCTNRVGTPYRGGSSHERLEDHDDE
jgi:hypothetical protein